MLGPKPTTFPKFLELPSEIRNKIYRLVLSRPLAIYVKSHRALDRFVTSSRTDRTTTKEARPGLTSLLCVCRQIRDEASSIFYFENVFIATACNPPGKDDMQISSWMQQIGVHNSRHVRHMMLINFDRWVPNKKAICARVISTKARQWFNVDIARPLPGSWYRREEWCPRSGRQLDESQEFVNMLEELGSLQDIRMWLIVQMLQPKEVNGELEVKTSWNKYWIEDVSRACRRQGTNDNHAESELAQRQRLGEYEPASSAATRNGSVVHVTERSFASQLPQVNVRFEPLNRGARSSYSFMGNVAV